MVKYATTIELADYENKDDTKIAYLLEQGRKVNLLVPGQNDEAWLYCLTKDGLDYEVSIESKEIVRIFSDENKSTLCELLNQIKVIPVKMDKNHHASLIVTAPDFLLDYPRAYLMSLLKNKKKAIFRNIIK